jgi:L-lactate dehydrogenase (cytochrome)
MDSKMIRIIVVVMAVFMIAACTSTSKNPDAPVQIQDAEENDAPPVQQDGGISTDELAKHSSTSDCWVAFEGKAYDITEFLPQHPGGVNAIARHCGTQKFEEAFKGKHGTSKIGKFMEKTIFKGSLA